MTVQNADHVTKLKKDKVKDKSFYNVAKSKLTQQLLGKSIYPTATGMKFICKTLLMIPM
jgi:hypothetical protein